MSLLNRRVVTDVDTASDATASSSVERDSDLQPASPAARAARASRRLCSCFRRAAEASAAAGCCTDASAAGGSPTKMSIALEAEAGPRQTQIQVLGLQYVG